MIDHPESMRFCGFQNITVSLPQAAYRAGKGNLEGLYKEIDRGMDIAIKAHFEKKNFVARLMAAPNMPLWEIGKTAHDGRPYVDLEAATYIVGIIGLNECLQFMIGKELHDDDEALKLGLRIISHMYFRVKEEGKKHNLKFSLEESPAESASRRLAKIDVRNYPEAVDMVKGHMERDEFYYTNSVHLRPDAPVDMVKRIEVQSMFHGMIESGAIIHAFVGEERPPSSSIMKLVKRTFENTQAAQLTISPEFTICNSCNRVIPRLVDQCPHCDVSNLYSIKRNATPEKVNNWDMSKMQELVDRHEEKATALNKSCK